MFLCAVACCRVSECCIALWISVLGVLRRVVVCFTVVLCCGMLWCVGVMWCVLECCGGLLYDGVVYCDVVRFGVVYCFVVCCGDVPVVL